MNIGCLICCHYNHCPSKHLCACSYAQVWRFFFSTFFHAPYFETVFLILLGVSCKQHVAIFSSQSDHLSSGWFQFYYILWQMLLLPLSTSPLPSGVLLSWGMSLQVDLLSSHVRVLLPLCLRAFSGAADTCSAQDRLSAEMTGSWATGRQLLSTGPCLSASSAQWVILLLGSHNLRGSSLQLNPKCPKLPPAH